jgi:hypothetical protein
VPGVGETLRCTAHGAEHRHLALVSQRGSVRQEIPPARTEASRCVRPTGRPVQRGLA